MALGMSNYMIGCLPGYKRAFLWFGGIHGDKQRGMASLDADRRGPWPLSAALRKDAAGAGLRARTPAGTSARDFSPNWRRNFRRTGFCARELALVEQKHCVLQTLGQSTLTTSRERDKSSVACHLLHGNWKPIVVANRACPTCNSSSPLPNRRRSARELPRSLARPCDFAE